MWTYGNITVEPSENMDDFYVLSRPEQGYTWNEWVGLACVILGQRNSATSSPKRYTRAAKRLAVIQDGDLFHGHNPRNDSVYAEGSLGDWQELARRILE